MKNQIIRISGLEKEAIKNRLEQEGYFIAEIDGKRIKQENRNKELYIDLLAEAFKINLSSYSIDDLHNRWIDEFMQDLYWLNNEKGYVLFIDNMEYLRGLWYWAKKGEDITNQLMGNLLMNYMYWWEEDVERVQTGSKRKKFDVYLVDNISSLDIAE